MRQKKKSDTSNIKKIPRFFFWKGRGGLEAMKQKPWFFLPSKEILKKDRSYVSKASPLPTPPRRSFKLQTSPPRIKNGYSPLSWGQQILMGEKRKPEIPARVVHVAWVKRASTGYYCIPTPPSLWREGEVYFYLALGGEGGGGIFASESNEKKRISWWIGDSWKIPEKEDLVWGGVVSRPLGLLRAE